MEFSFCRNRLVLLNLPFFFYGMCSVVPVGNLRSTSFLVYESGALLSCTICTTWRRSSSPSRWRPSANLSISTCENDFMLGCALGFAMYKGSRGLTLFSVRFFFFEPSSLAAERLDFTPFSSPGMGPDSRRVANKAGLGFLNV